MTEYITKEQALELLDDGDMYARKALTEMKSADVIKRAQYNRVLELIAYLCEEHDKRVTEYNNLRSKVDKAIESIKQDIIEHSGTGEEVIQAYCDGLKKALEYLENIGE